MDNLIDILLDPENEENITLYNTDDEPTEFEQIAVIPFTVGEEERLYAILKPVVAPEGMDDMSVIVFRVDEEEDGAYIVVEDDDEVAEAVFAEFEKLLEENDEP